MTVDGAFKNYKRESQYKLGLIFNSPITKKKSDRLAVKE